MSDILGNIHSIETCGTVDGPGIRFVVFTQGCPMRCLYCHNPDSWSTGINKQMSIREILGQYESVKEFCKGGITVTGGEPLMQIEFVTELFKSAKEKGIHTALDTSGVLFNPENTQKFDELLKYTDLVMLDIKHIDDKKCRELVGLSNKNELAFARYLDEHNIPVWIRQVLVPGFTDDEEDLKELKRFINTLNNVQKFEFLLYHDLGKYKWIDLGKKYPLEGVRTANNKDLEKALKVMESVEK
jgi:pyruvate formate lyase activating enzyme